MEEYSILSDQQIEQLKKPNKELLHTFLRFCGCTKEELIDVFEMRNKKRTYGKVVINGQEKEELLLFGYKLFSQKIGKKYRKIKVPENLLKKIQYNIKPSLESLPVSLGVMGGRKGDNIVKNAELHKNNPYVISLDLKDAFPNVNGKRVYENMKGAIGKALPIRAPLLENDVDKNLFIRGVTHLLVHNNELPQGACTSTQVMNIVLAKMDADIVKLLHILVPNAVYSRYIDDITVSFPEYGTMETLKKQLNIYIDKLNSFIENKKTSNIASIDELIDGFSNETFTVSDKYELDSMHTFIQIIKGLLITFGSQQSVNTSSQIGIIDKRKRQIDMPGENLIQTIKKSLISVIGSNGFKVNQIKTKRRTPQSGGMREITGVAYTHEGKRSIPSVKRRLIQKLFNDLAQMGSEDLFNNTLYRKIFFDQEELIINKEKIINLLKGKYAYLALVYGKNNVPRKLREDFEKAIVKRTGIGVIPSIDGEIDRGINLGDQLDEYDYIPF